MLTVSWLRDFCPCLAGVLSNVSNVVGRNDRQQWNDLTCSNGHEDLPCSIFMATSVAK